MRSRPSRARGLKLAITDSVGIEQPVAPFTGAWIETPRACVPHRGIVSRPSRARGLKQSTQGLD